jgi:hypothetical protein
MIDSPDKRLMSKNVEYPHTITQFSINGCFALHVNTATLFVSFTYYVHENPRLSLIHDTSLVTLTNEDETRRNAFVPHMLLQQGVKLVQYVL